MSDPIHRGPPPPPTLGWIGLTLLAVVSFILGWVLSQLIAFNLMVA